MVKSKSYNTKPAVSIPHCTPFHHPHAYHALLYCICKVLRTFLCLRLEDVDDPVSATSSQSRPAKTKQERKERKKEKMTKKQKRVSWCFSLAASKIERQFEGSCGAPKH